MSVSAERTRAVPHRMSRILPQPDVEIGIVPVPMPEDAMEVDLETLEWCQHWREEAQREPVRYGWNVRIKPTWRLS